MQKAAAGVRSFRSPEMKGWTARGVNETLTATNLAAEYANGIENDKKLDMKKEKKIVAPLKVL